jgi:DNA-binding IclR family transcriptional regulator
MGLTEICNQIGVHKNKDYSILPTLVQYGFIEKDLQTKIYFFDPNLLFLSRNFLNNLYYLDVVALFLESLNFSLGRLNKVPFHL